MKLVRGRYFSDRDNELSENVAIVKEAFVRRFFSPGEDPIDRRFGLNVPENVNTFRTFRRAHWSHSSRARSPTRIPT